MTTTEDACKNGDKYNCPNMKYDDSDTSMESER